jgi:hypothetical protein
MGIIFFKFWKIILLDENRREALASGVLLWDFGYLKGEGSWDLI